MRGVVLVEPTVLPLGFTIAATCTRLGFVSHQKQGCTSEHALHEDPNILRAQDEAFSSLPLHNDLGSGKGRRPTPGSPLFGIGHVHTSRCRASAKSGSAPFTSMTEPFSEGNRAIPVGSHGCPLYPSFGRHRIPWVRATRRWPTARAMRTCCTLVYPWLPLYPRLASMSAYNRVCTAMAGVHGVEQACLR